MSIAEKVLVCCVFCAMTASAFAVDGVSGETVRPQLTKAMISGCDIAEPGKYNVNVGDLIELDYRYPVVPTAIPKAASFKASGGGAVTQSPLGIRRVHTPKLIGTETIGFYFEAKKAGSEKITLDIDGKQYVYDFTVK